MCTIDRINACLSSIGKSGAEMSRDLGLSNSIYSQWNTGKTRPSNKTLLKVANYLGVTVDYLLTGDNGESATKIEKKKAHHVNDEPLIDLEKASDIKIQFIKRCMELSDAQISALSSALDAFIANQ